MSAAPPLFGIRLSFFYAMSFVVSGISVPFLPVWLHGRGFGPQEIAACLAFPLAARAFVMPGGSWLADHAPNRRFAIVIFSAAALACFVPATLVHSIPAILILSGLAVTMWQMTQPASDALALTGVRRFGLDYGRMRVWGSISFVVVSLIGGTIFGHFGSAALTPMLIAGFSICLAASFTLPVTPRAERAADSESRPRARSAGSVLRAPAFIVIVATTALIQSSHGMFYSFSTLQWEALGFSGSQIGVLWATGVVAEIVMFTVSSRLTRLGPETLILAGAIAAVIRWALFPFATGFMPNFLLQILHAFTFGASFVGMQLAVARTVPEEFTASALGLCNIMAGILMALTTLIGGPLYARFGVDAFWVMTGFAGLAVAINLSARLGLYPQRAASGGETRLP